MERRDSKGTFVRSSIGRAAFVGVSLCLQVGWIVSLLSRAHAYYPYITLATGICSLIVVVGVYNNQYRNAASKMIWMLLILLLPVFGLCLYFLMGQPWATHYIRKRFDAAQADLSEYLIQDEAVSAALREQDRAAANQSAYLAKWAKCPVYKNSDVRYHASGEAAFEDLKAELKTAEKFIFMEYHAIELSQCFMELESILAERAAAGVEVRIFYDDLGSAPFINRDFRKRLQDEGIQCRVFNPIRPVINAFMNNRDHRKITVIDGRVAFTGGYNLADEYFNVKHPFGQWKDTGIKITGDAVRSFTVLFLGMWNVIDKTDADYSRYIDVENPVPEAAGFVQPYADSPLDDERTGENVYMNILKNAKEYAWITTPYLILDDEMQRELCLAAKRGVDVRIITPGIPDKKLVYQLTRSYYSGLAAEGVRIYEYAPGFIHSKMMLSDDAVGVVGTINLDYRSLYLHFENAVLLHRCPALAELRADFEGTFPQCREVTHRGVSRSMRILQSLLRLFAPIL